MTYNKHIYIAVGPRANAIYWERQCVQWLDFVERLRIPQRTGETQAEYWDGDKAFRSAKKDVGGFVGGILEGHKRSKRNVMGRDLITLDLDDCPRDVVERIEERLAAYEYVVYSTHSHTPERPRLRLIMPTTERLDRDEYAIVSRAVAHYVGEEYFDPSTFQPERLMYWPSASEDGEYIFSHHEGVAIDKSVWLDMEQGKFREQRHWQLSQREQKSIDKEIGEAVDPRSKRNAIGAFCRVYGISEAISTFIPEVFTPAPGGRYTYNGASSIGGAVLYNDLFLYSHHATDPYNSACLNAFDLVRLHKYGHLDTDSSQRIDKRPSYNAMMKLCDKDARVRVALISASTGFTDEDFEPEDAKPTTAPTTAKEQADSHWMTLLEVDSKSGNVRKTCDNVFLILQHDPELKDKLYYDEYRAKAYLSGPTPWQTNSRATVERPKEWTDKDESGFVWYLEKAYGIIDKTRTLAGLDLILTKNSKHPVKRFIESATWDGTPRVDTLFVDYLGADDTPYVRAVTRKVITAAVTRIYEPGAKFDYITVLAGREGIGKSTLIKRLGAQWYSDSFFTVEGKEAMDQLRGAWLIEIAELSGLKKSEMTAIKAFVSKQEDQYRQAYGRNTTTYKRQCIFFGTTNEKDFVRNENGNRRFWVVPVGTTEARLKPWELTADVVAQVWAEALTIYRAGTEPLYLNAEQTQDLQVVQGRFSEPNELEAELREYLARPLPANFYDKTPEERRAFIQRNDEHRGRVVVGNYILREKVCLAEIIAEMMAGRVQLIDKRLRTELAKTLDQMPGLERGKVRIQGYGPRTGWLVDATLLSAGETSEYIQEYEADDMPF